MNVKNILFAASAAMVMHTASAHDNMKNEVKASNCAIQETIPGAKRTGAFLTMHKMGTQPLVLTAAAVPSVTKRAEIHQMTMANGTMKMEQIHSFPLKNGMNVFQKGGFHIMLMDLDKPLKVGEKHTITLTFNDKSTTTCDAVVKSVEDLTPKGMKMDHGKNMKHDMGKTMKMDHDKAMKHDMGGDMKMKDGQ